MTPLRAILIEDCEEDVALLVRALKREFALDFVNVQTAEALENALAAGPWDVVFTDYNLPKFNGVLAIEHIKSKQPDTPVIVVSGTIGEERAVELVKAGANDYVMKDNLTRVRTAVDRASKSPRTVASAGKQRRR
jgi:DNA-binding NtrC family response regulator